jgi:hypothetical protein
MKHAFFFITFIVICNLSFSQNSNTYEIEKLSKPKYFIKQISKKEYIKYQNDKVEKCSNLPSRFIDFGENPFLAGLIKAYQEHRPFTISPDIVWLLISQGFARHISFNSEKYRKSFVNFNNKQNLKIEARKYIKLGDTSSKWENVFPQLTTQISNFIDSEIVNVLTADFSTTTETSRIVSQITILETFKGYFNYEVDGRGCGIPKIVIEGTIDDWQKVLEKTNYISKYDLNWWTKELVPILNEIINTKKGNFNKNFWMNMVKVHSEKVYGSPDIITGWVIKFYPYFSNGQRTYFKPLKEIDRLPSEIVRVPFLFVDDSLNLKINMEFRAGFIGLTQNVADYTLKPEIGWLIYYKKRKLRK